MRRLNQDTLINRAEAEVAVCIKKAESFYKRQLSMPSVRFDLKGKAAGGAYPDHNVIRFNAVLLAENTQHFLMQTVPHEVAHLVARAVYGRGIRPHGKEWQSVMTQVFGCPPDRCHQYNCRNSVTRTVTYYAYTCQCGQDYRLSAIRHRRSLRRQARYLCAKCKTVLVPARASAGEK